MSKPVAEAAGGLLPTVGGGGIGGRGGFGFGGGLRCGGGGGGRTIDVEGGLLCWG